MNDQLEVSREILNKFLQEWPIEKVKNMTLDQYVSTNDQNTFCYWVELMAKELGNIRGYTSIKFGIYKRKKNKDKPKRMMSDDEYTWQKYYGKTRDEAFANVKSELVQIIKHAKDGAFNKIDSYKLNPLFRWKIAFLYSGERLVPIYKREVLVDIGNGYSMDVTKKTPYSVLYNEIINQKPVNLNIYQYATYLYTKYVLDKKSKSKTKGRKNKGTTKKSTKAVVKKGSKGSVVSQKHNILQNKLYEWLLIKHGGEKFVIMEKNYVDIMVLLKNETIFYEVKSDEYAGDCIKAALGQLLTYVYRDKSNKDKSLVVAGKNKPNKDEKCFIKYLNEKLSFNFSYISIEDKVK